MNTQKKPRTRWAVLLVCAAALWSPGCRTPSAAPRPAAAKIPERKVRMTVGRIIRVNREYGYVVVQCAGLPTIGEEATVYRGAEAAGRVAMTGPQHMPFMIADIVDGAPSTGDFVRVMRSAGAAAPDDGGGQ